MGRFDSREPARRVRVAPEQVRERIMESFASKAMSVGLRGVMMAEIASELRVSASTLYKHFPSKEALTLACVERWADEFAATHGAANDAQPKREPFEQFVHWIEAWADAHAALSPAFVRDLESDYPAAYKHFRAVVTQHKQHGAALLRPELKRDLDERVALAILDLILGTVVRPEFADRLRISRHEAIRTAVSIWAGGALNRRGKVLPLRDTAPALRGGANGEGKRRQP